MKLVNICNNCQLVTMNGRTIIFSYGTPVLSVEWMGGSFQLHRYWSGWSMTTTRHINKSLEAMGVFYRMTKQNWDKMPVEEVDA